MIDVVEGTALESLAHMQTFLRHVDTSILTILMRESILSRPSMYCVGGGYGPGHDVEKFWFKYNEIFGVPFLSLLFYLKPAPPPRLVLKNNNNIFEQLSFTKKLFLNNIFQLPLPSAITFR